MYKFLQACTRIKMYKDRCISKTKVKHAIDPMTNDWYGSIKIYSTDSTQS